MHQNSYPSKPGPFGFSLLGSNADRLPNTPGGSPNLTQPKLAPESRSSSPFAERPEARQIISRTSWLEGARQSTKNFNRYGSSTPLVWVLVEDNVIPSNAVPFGEDKNGFPLYIARALLEGGLYLGKAGTHLPHALISYGGREQRIKNFEVLVCASQLRWGLAFNQPVGSSNSNHGTVIFAQQNQHLLQSGHGPAVRTAQAGASTPRGQPGGLAAQTGHSNVQEMRSILETRKTHNSRKMSSVIGTMLCVNDIPRVIPKITIEDTFKKLGDYKTVILIDDSISMAQEQSWSLVREALAGIADLANQYGSHGIDLHFLHHEKFHENIKTSLRVTQIFNQTRFEGQDTPTAAKLEHLINQYLPLVERKRPQHKPINIIIITDGVATDNEALPGVIVTAAQRLESSQVPEEMFGIQFLQIGTDADAAAALRSLDDHLAKEHKIRDIVDFTPYDPQQGTFNTNYMLKILLGGINKALDNGDCVPSELLSPLAIPQQKEHGQGNHD